ncbi:hypothetical protein TNCV_363601 [Trichonephila clavipes]|nr:hypothetical protein TNCV_363601 [Trichonephila clavipes]
MGRQLHLTRNVHDLARELEKIGQKIPQETTRVIYHPVSGRVTAASRLECYKCNNSSKAWEKPRTNYSKTQEHCTRIVKKGYVLYSGARYTPDFTVLQEWKNA